MPDNTTYTFAVTLHCTATIGGDIADECRATIARDMRDLMGDTGETENGATMRFLSFEVGAATAPALDDAKVHHRCPECGDRDHLSGRSDSRWDFARQEWVVGDMEDQVECMECDWSGTMQQTISTSEGEA
ncbi:hypothetical protein [Novosphingobium sp. FKTRR1]|uniref:hypothetical protein n=1 Tax=Novosphingobium sp. FKTRR1 TaxID=2879118 RepID=UPI001CEFECC9|nr:hypothetical protein [Novosphingobium sp. FKTRR1]